LTKLCAVLITAVFKTYLVIFCYPVRKIFWNRNWVPGLLFSSLTGIYQNICSTISIVLTENLSRKRTSFVWIQHKKGLNSISWGFLIPNLKWQAWIVWIVEFFFTWTSLRWKWKNEGSRAFSSGHCTPETLWLKISQLLHKIWTLHESHVSKMKVTENLKKNIYIKFFTRQTICKVSWIPGQDFKENIAVPAEYFFGLNINLANYCLIFVSPRSFLICSWEIHSTIVTF